MNVLRGIEQLNLLHGLLCSQQTGTPGALCRRLGMSRSKLYVVMGDLRDRGASIAYSRDRQTYYYRNDFRVDIICRLGPPGEEDRLTSLNRDHAIISFG